MDISEFSKLVEKYKRGELSRQEKERLESFLESFQTNSGKWVENEMGNQRIIEERVFSRIQESIHGEKIHYVNRTFFSPSLLKRAAAIAFFFIVSYGLLYISGVFSKRTVPVVWCEAVTSAGEKSILVLSDGSQITLNADSRLRYPYQFSGTNREVYLEGEGYFVVHHRNDQPFVVHTGDLSTTVLGTKFNVSAYPDSKTIAVSLLEGKVKVSRNEEGRIDKAVVIVPKEQLLYDKEHDTSSFSLFDSLEAVGWKDNIYKFEDEPLANVLFQLERAFAVKFKITDQQVLVQRITIKFENNSLQTVAEVLKSLTGLNYHIVSDSGEAREVVFFGKTK